MLNTYAKYSPLLKQTSLFLIVQGEPVQRAPQHALNRCVVINQEAPCQGDHPPYFDCQLNKFVHTCKLCETCFWCMPHHIILVFFPHYIFRSSYLTAWAQHWEKTPDVPGAQAAILSKALHDMKHMGKQAMLDTWNADGLWGFLRSTLKAAFQDDKVLTDSELAILADEVCGFSQGMSTAIRGFGGLETTVSR